MTNGESTPIPQETTPQPNGIPEGPLAPEKDIPALEKMPEGKEITIEKPQEDLPEKKEDEKKGELKKKEVKKKFEPTQAEDSEDEVQKASKLIEETAKKKGIDAAMRLIRDKKMYEKYGALLFDGLGHDTLKEIEKELPDDELKKLKKL